MTDDDSYQADGDDENPEFVVVRFQLRQDYFDKITTAAATQGVSVSHALNSAVQHYDLTMTVEPGNMLRFKDASDQVRRVYVVPADFKRWERWQGLGILMMVLAGPLTMRTPLFFFLWLAGLLAFVIGWLEMKVKG